LKTIRRVACGKIGPLEAEESRVQRPEKKEGDDELVLVATL